MGATHVTWREATLADAVVRVDSMTWASEEHMRAYLDPMRASQPMWTRFVWAQFDAEGQFVRAGEGMLAPTAEELAAWASEAPARAARYTRPTGLPEEMYIRFNRLPKGGRSRNYLTGELEDGVSVYAATYNRETERIELEEDGTAGGTAVSYILAGNRVPTYLLTGEAIGRGSDGEPLLRKPRIIGTLTYDLERGGYRLHRKGTK